MRILHSAEDSSVNFVFDNGQESRFVQRVPDYFIVYLSSHGGCNQACRFCHLTQTGQTLMKETTLHEYIDQAEAVLDHALTKQVRVPDRIHFNWMARGEPLSSKILRERWYSITLNLTSMSNIFGVEDVQFNISTIMPEDVQLPLYFEGPNPRIYYSLYSLDPQFRKRWLPKAANPMFALSELERWQYRTGGEIVLHWAMIEGENDSEETVTEIAEVITEFGLKARFNLVRYNPFSIGQGRESSEAVLKRNFNILANAMSVPGSRIVPRVGFDVKASCGMFV